MNYNQQQNWDQQRDWNHRNWRQRNWRYRKPIRYFTVVQEVVPAPVNLNFTLDYCTLKIDQISNDGIVTVIPTKDIYTPETCPFGGKNGILVVEQRDGTIQKIETLNGWVNQNNQNQFELVNPEDRQYFKKNQIVTFQKKELPTNQNNIKKHDFYQEERIPVIYKTPTDTQQYPNSTTYYAKEYQCRFKVVNKMTSFQLYLQLVNDECFVPLNNGFSTLDEIPIQGTVLGPVELFSGKMVYVAKFSNQKDYDHFQLGQNYMWRGFEYVN